MSSSIRCLILSDTHDSAFPPPEQLPTADVVLHCGDLTNVGGLSNYKAAIKSLTECKADLKLVIPGNHDVSLDHKWWMDSLDEDDDPEEPEKAQKLFHKAQDGLRLLEEGRHEFTLKDGRTFSLFASPYTPAFEGYAFAYDPKKSQWEKIPGDVDIIMTHGPPRAPQPDYRLDLNHEGQHCGCPNLWTHLERSKPKLHCFGHIHEGHGVTWIDWEKKKLENAKFITCKTSDVSSCGRIEVKALKNKTLLVNAAIMSHGDEANNYPWVVDLEL